MKQTVIVVILGLALASGIVSCSGDEIGPGTDQVLPSSQPDSFSSSSSVSIPVSSGHSQSSSASVSSTHSSQPASSSSTGPASGVVFVFHVNDMHGSLDGYPKIAWLIKQYQATNANVMVVSAGDGFSGNPYVDQYTPPGYPMIDVMYQSGFRLSAIGNHEFDYGQAELNARMSQTSMRWISANITVSGGVLQQPVATFATNFPGGMELVFLGLTERNSQGIPSTHPDKVLGLTFSDPITVASGFAALPRQNRAVIGLTHIGAGTDNSLATSCSWLDVILGGHSHSVIEGGSGVSGTPLIAQAGTKLAYLGVVRLRFVNGQVTEKSSTLVPVAGIAGEDSAVRTLVDGYMNNPFMDAQIATLSVTLSGQSLLGSFMTDGQRHVTGAVAAFQNNGGIRISSLPAGPLSRKQIFELDPFGNELVTYMMTLSQLQALCAARSDLQVSGIKINKSYSPYRLTDYAGTELGSGPHKVALSTYLASTTSFSFESGPVYAGMTTADALIQYAIDTATIGTPEAQPRIGSW